MSTSETRPPRRGATAEEGGALHGRGARGARQGGARRGAAESHGEWEPALHRPDPVELLEEQAASRVPELVPIRYGRMLVSPFTFYRGAAYLMASDLVGRPLGPGLHTQLCGDAHLSNFGVFAAPDRRLVFSINDFDETLPGPFEWDVKRLVASFAVAGRDRGFDDEACGPRSTRPSAALPRGDAPATPGCGTSTSGTTASTSRRSSRSSRRRPTAEQKKRLDKNVAKARTKDSLAAFDKLTETVDGEPRIVGDPPLIVPIERARRRAEATQTRRLRCASMIRSYRRTLSGDRRKLLERFRFVDAARKVVGVGSVGTRAWIILMLGRDDADPLFLQAKEAQASVLEPFLGHSEFATTASASSRASA